MNAIDTLSKILDCSIASSNLRFCLVNASKLPFKIDGTMAKPNQNDDFVELEQLVQSENLGSYSGIGISIQASNICAIDVDHCFEKPNDISTISEIGEQILEMFREHAYCEFSFSGTGLRILFKAPVFDNYALKYYIKNSEKGIEYYQPSQSFRYVTVTGNAIADNSIELIDTTLLTTFLDLFMQRPQRKSTATVTICDMTDEQCINKIKFLYFKDGQFQNLWFKPAPGSGADESERDYHLVAYLYENVTQNKEQLKRLFELSPFFKTKDSKHMYKWTQQEFRYFNYVFSMVEQRH